MSTSQSLPTTADQLKSASLSQLHTWAQVLNNQSAASGGARAITNMSLNKDDILQALADCLKIDLSVPPPIELRTEDVEPAPGPAEESRPQKQYDFMLDLYNDWGEREDYQFSSSSGPGTVDPETADARELAKQRFQRP